MGINKIILSSNEDPVYLEFWKPVSWAYKQMFPDVEVHLALLTNKPEDHKLITNLRKWGKITLFKPDPNISEFAQAKMIRFILASQQGSDVCYIDDIDLFPLSKTFITDKTDKRPKDHLLCVGGEVYDNNGCYPISQMTAEGYVWKHFINPSNLTYSQLMEEWGKEPKWDRRENINMVTNFAIDDYFSDERLIRRLTGENPVPKFEMERGYKDFMESTIDRYDWKVDIEKLNNHGYLNAHCIRPCGLYVEEFIPLFNYIKANYGA